MADAGLEVRARRRVIGADALQVAARPGDVIVPGELATLLVDALAPVVQRVPAGFVAESVRELFLACRIAATRPDAGTAFVHESAGEKLVDTTDRGTHPGSREHVDVTEAARQLGISEQAVRARCRNGRLDADRVAGRWLIVGPRAGWRGPSD